MGLVNDPTCAVYVSFVIRTRTVLLSENWSHNHISFHICVRPLHANVVGESCLRMSQVNVVCEPCKSVHTVCNILQLTDVTKVTYRQWPSTFLIGPCYKHYLQHWPLTLLVMTYHQYYRHHWPPTFPDVIGHQHFQTSLATNVYICHRLPTLPGIPCHRMHWPPTALVITYHQHVPSSLATNVTSHHWPPMLPGIMVINGHQRY